MKDTPACPACDSRYTLHVQDVVGNRTGLFYPQHYCMDCQGFFHRSGYKETAQQKEDDYGFLFSHRENHKALQSQLFLEIKTRLPALRSVCEVGHGLGLFLKAVQDYGCDGHGFEVSAPCHDFAANQLGLSCELGLFEAGHQRTYDLIASIMVFEHLETPRELFATMRSKLNRDGAIYLRRAVRRAAGLAVSLDGGNGARPDAAPTCFTITMCISRISASKVCAGWG